MNASPETVLGLTLGVLTAAYLWYNSSEGKEAKPPQPRRLRDFTANDLTVYDGKQGRLAYVALAEPEDGVYDVTKDTTGEYAEYAGKEVSKKVDADKIKSNFELVGKLIRPRDI